MIGEIAMGSLKNRSEVLGTLQTLPQPALARDEEVLRFIQERKLFGLGIGYIDAQLLTSIRLTPGTLLWTRDKRLHMAAISLSLASTDS